MPTARTTGTASFRRFRFEARFVCGIIEVLPCLGCLQGHWKTITFVAALRWHGMRASQTIDGSMTGKKFLAYVERCLAPTLKQGYRHDRQSSGTQGCGCPRGDRSARRDASLSAQIFAICARLPSAQFLACAAESADSRVPLTAREASFSGTQAMREIERNLL
jgi:hypothetical protein